MMPWLLLSGKRPWGVSSNVGSFWREPGVGEGIGWKESSLESQTHLVPVPGLPLISSGVMGKWLDLLELLFLL